MEELHLRVLMFWLWFFHELLEPFLTLCLEELEELTKPEATAAAR